MNEVRCQIKRGLWWMVPVVVLFGAMMLFATFQLVQEKTASLDWAPILMGVSTVIFSLYALIFFVCSLLREEVIADEIGLRWRGAFGPWKSARWDEVTDFYLIGILSQTKVVETLQGQLKINHDTHLTNEKSLMDFIAARATKVPLREWEIQRFRAAKPFSEKFVYWSKTQKWYMPLVSAVFVAACIGRIALASSERRTNIELHYFLTPWPLAVLFVIFFGAIGILCFIAPLLLWRERSAAYQRRHEFIEISPNGLKWQSEQDHIEAAWDEVRAISATTTRSFAARRDYHVETQNGDFTVSHTLDRLELWLQLVRQFAPHLAPEPQQTSVDLGGEISTWSGGEVGSGARIFHFRTSDTRIFLWLPTLVTPCLLLIPLFQHVLQTPDDSSTAPTSTWVWLAIAATLLVTILCWLCFARAALWADETALEWRLPFLPTRRVAWSEIEAMGRDESGVWLQIGGQKRRLWRGFAPVRQAELLQLIESRAVKATGRFD